MIGSNRPTRGDNQHYNPVAKVEENINEHHRVSEGHAGNEDHAGRTEECAK
jgi:hypothetical protein